MKNIEINTPDGKVLSLTAPDDATPDQIHSAAQQAMVHYQQTMKPPTAQQQSVQGNWEGLREVPLAVPEQAPSQGLAAIGDLVAGKGLQQAAQTAETNEPVSVPGAVGKFIGQGVKPSTIAETAMLSAVTPSRAAMQAGEFGQAGRIISGPGRQEAGQAMGALEHQAGLETDVVPSLKQMTGKLGLPKSASTKEYITAVIKAAKDKSIPPQELLEHHKLITSLLENEPSKLAKLLQGAKSPLGGTGGSAIASKADSMIVQQLNEAVPGRANQAANYAAAMTRNKFYRGAGYVAGTGLSALAGPKLAELLKKAWGH